VFGPLTAATSSFKYAQATLFCAIVAPGTIITAAKNAAAAKHVIAFLIVFFIVVFLVKNLLSHSPHYQDISYPPPP
jgi:hypothetical protein